VIVVASVSGSGPSARHRKAPGNDAWIGALERPMLDRIAEGFYALLSYVPALFVDSRSANFGLVRAMFGLIIIVIIVYLIAMRPMRPVRVAIWSYVRGLFGRKA
jgi:hypothetical protein